MILFFLISSTWKYRVLDEGFGGRLWCPRCRRITRFAEIAAARYLAVWFIPVWPVRRYPPHLQCSRCQDRWEVPASYPHPDDLQAAERLQDAADAEYAPATPQED